MCELFISIVDQPSGRTIWKGWLHYFLYFCPTPFEYVLILLLVWRELLKTKNIRDDLIKWNTTWRNLYFTHMCPAKAQISLRIRKFGHRDKDPMSRPVNSLMVHCWCCDTKQKSDQVTLYDSTASNFFSLVYFTSLNITKRRISYADVIIKVL